MEFPFLNIPAKGAFAVGGVLLTTLLPTSLCAVVSPESFENPPNEFRITQYQLSPRTLKQYPEYGVGGVMGFFYSILYPESERQIYRLGLNGPEIIGDLVADARKQDWKVWLADDWGYPSGSAGGRVVSDNPDFEVKSLVMLTVSGSGPEAIDYTLPKDLHDIVHARLYPVTNGQIDLAQGTVVPTCQTSVSAKGICGEWELRIFARYVRDKDTQAQSTMPQFGHAGRYPDLMSREAMSRFIANMHEPILAQIDDPAKNVEGFYCNEPNLMQTHWDRTSTAPYACTPWSDGLPDWFTKMHGYDLYSILPHLFDGDSDEARRARIHYRQAVADLLTDSFSRQIREWCNARGIKSSGHFLLNYYLSMHVQGYGDLMKFVSEFDVPALDIPIPNPDEFKEFDYQQSRFFSSVASWKEKDMTIMLLDPIIGGYGRSRLSPELPLLLNSVNMAAFHGVNFFTSYLPFEKRGGTVVRGYEEKATGYTREEYRFFNEYTGRITQVLSGAKRDAGVGLYYPIAMFQADLTASDKPFPVIRNQHKAREDAWERTERALMDGDIEYMIVHPEAVAEAGIADGRMKIGFGSYHTLVIPQMEFIPLNVLKQLKQFEESGGKVIWVDQVPYGAEYAKNDTAVNAALAGAQAVPVDALASQIPQSCSPQFDLTFTPGTNQLTVGRFLQKGEQVYLLINREQESITVGVEGSGSVKVLDPSTGEITTTVLPARLPLQPVRALMLNPQ